MSEDDHSPREFEYSISFDNCRKLTPLKPKIEASVALAEFESETDDRDPYKFGEQKYDEEGEEQPETEEREIMSGSGKFDCVCSCRRASDSEYKFRMFKASTMNCERSFYLNVEQISSLVICGDDEPLVFIGTGDSIRQVNLDTEGFDLGYEVGVPGGVEEIQASPVSSCIYGRSEDRLFVWYYAKQESRCIASGVSTFYVDMSGVWVVSDDRLFKYTDDTREVREIGGLCPGTTKIRSMSYCWLLSAGCRDNGYSVCWWNSSVGDSSGICCGYVEMDEEVENSELEIVADRELGIACVLHRERESPVFLMLREDKGSANLVRVRLKNEGLESTWGYDWKDGGQLAVVIQNQKQEENLEDEEKRWIYVNGMYFGTTVDGQCSCFPIEHNCDPRDRWVDTSLLTVQSRSKNIQVVLGTSGTWLMRVISPNNILNYRIDASYHRILDVTFSVDEDVMYVLAQGTMILGVSYTPYETVAVLAFGCYPPRHLMTYFSTSAVFSQIHPHRFIVSDLLGTITVQDTDGREIVFKKAESLAPAYPLAAEAPPTLEEIRAKMKDLTARFKKVEDRMNRDSSSELAKKMVNLARRLTNLIYLADKIGFKARPGVSSCPKDAVLEARAEVLLNKLEHALWKSGTPSYHVRRADREPCAWFARAMSTLGL